MNGDINPGTECFLEHEFIEEGRKAFDDNELVTVISVAPDRLRPAFKFLVHSEKLGRDILLRELDLRRKYCPDCGRELDYDLEACQECTWQIPQKKQRSTDGDDTVWRTF